MKIYKKWLALLLSVSMAAAPVFSVRAEESGYEESGEASDDAAQEEEEEFIPEAYYDPIETNAILGWPQGPMIQAAGGIVMDMDTNAIIYGKNLDQVHYPASITKIMTTLLALEHCNLDDVITCGSEVYDLEENSTHLGIQDGEKVTVRQALYGVMLESANDLANAVAVHVSGSISAFADLMNEKADSLGCTHTHFANPSGLNDDNHYTTVRDMAKIAQAAYENADFRKITSTTEYTIPSTNLTEEDRSFLNHQKILRSDTEYYQSWCTGGKTGYTSIAWNTLVTYAEADGRKLVCVLLCENGADRAYRETTELIQYAFTEFKNEVIGQPDYIPSFYDMLKLNYPNAGDTVIQTDELKQPVMSVTKSGTVTLPSYASSDELKRKAANGGADVEYTWQGYHMGEGAVAFHPVPSGITLSYEQSRDMDTLLLQGEAYRRQSELAQTANLAITNLKTGGSDIYEAAKNYIEKNTLTVVLIGVFVLAILLIMIIILIMRCTRESRIRRRRKAEEKARRRAEEDIDRMSAVEIEQQLRQAMAMEERRRKENQDE